MNIGEIAKLAGVSRATVSRYLNNGYVSEEKREKIKAVIEQTGYVPSSQAQMLRTKKTKLIGVILPKLGSESVSKIINGISEKLTGTGYHLLLANTDNNIEREIEYLNIFKNNQVDGVILIATILTKEHKQAMKELAVPIVVVGQELSGYCSVYHDDYHAAKQMTEVLIDAGCTSLAHIGVTKKDLAVGLDRQNGFADAIKERNAEGLALKEVAIEEGDFSMESGYTLMKEILARKEKVDGIFGATDSIAIGAMEAIKEAGLRIPEDISVVGMGNTKISRVVSPRLTTMKYYYDRSGIEAADILLNLIEDEMYCIKNIKLGYEMVHRQSIKG